MQLIQTLKGTMHCRMPRSGVTQTSNYMGFVQNFHKGKVYVHIFVHMIQIMFPKEKQEKPTRKGEKRVRVRAHKPKYSRLTSNFCRLSLVFCIVLNLPICMVAITEFVLSRQVVEALWYDLFCTSCHPGMRRSFKVSPQGLHRAC